MDERGNEWGKSLSEIAFGRDISGLSWEQLTPAEKRAINELAQSPALPLWVERLALQAPPEPVKVVVDAAPRDWVIPAGHQNRKARRAARSDRRRAAWKALKAHPKGKQNFAAFVQREIERGRALELKALADPGWLAEQVLLAQPPTEKT